MIFTSLAYGAFFVVVFVIHWLLPRGLRRPWLLIASYYFYLHAFPIYGLLIAGMTAGNYVMGRIIWPASGGWRRAMLVVAIAGNLLTLGYFKYTNLLLPGIWPALRLLPEMPRSPMILNIILPLGISFFTFEFIHYVVEVYRGHAPIKNPIDFALFAAFFPTQIAGPIKRFPDWVKQLQHPAKLRDVPAHEGVQLILRGVVKKIVVADMLAPLVATGFAHPERLQFGATWLVIYAFAAQIYADFSGYTDIGRGCAMLLGYAVPINFNSPYQARNPGEFWERWHISLSRWLRDYLYIPLGGSRVAPWRIYLNLMITMALGGLWHGASWHFMIWGVYQGALLVGHRLWQQGSALLPLPAQHWAASRHGILAGRIATFHLVCFGWLIFRADTPESLGTLIRVALVPHFANLSGGLSDLTTPSLTLACAVLAVAAIIVVSGWLTDWLRDGLPAMWQRVSGGLGG
ncbi:MAG TPA: MBOAT family O-acyltransferase, partial [Ktedonobacterales bacterium]|nr:MBOAT family O-acyltransferase [Ktedonobacterales bacterium]